MYPLYPFTVRPLLSIESAGIVARKCAATQRLTARKALHEKLVAPSTNSIRNLLPPHVAINALTTLARWPHGDLVADVHGEFVEAYTSKGWRVHPHRSAKETLPTLITPRPCVLVGPRRADVPTWNFALWERIGAKPFPAGVGGHLTRGCLHKYLYTETKMATAVSSSSVRICGIAAAATAVATR